MYIRRIFPPALSRLSRITLSHYWHYGVERGQKRLPTFCASSLKVVMVSPTRRELPVDAHLGSASVSPLWPGRGRSADRGVLTPARHPPPSPPSCRHPWCRSPVSGPSTSTVMYPRSGWHASRVRSACPTAPATSDWHQPTRKSSRLLITVIFSIPTTGAGCGKACAWQ